MVPTCCCTLMTFFSTAELIMTLTTILQQDIDTMETWLLQNHLQLNAAKCKYMTISCKHSPPLNYQLSILNHGMEKVTEFKYLGVWLSDNMSWSTHIEKSVLYKSTQTSRVNLSQVLPILQSRVLATTLFVFH